LSEVGILIVDDDIASQRALKHVLDAEGWQVRIVPTAPQALPELASGVWNLAIVNVSLVDLKGPIFAILRDLAQADEQAETAAADAERATQTVADETIGADPKVDPAVQTEVATGEARRTRFRALFLVPMTVAPMVEPVLEEEGLPYSLKPYHLHDFLEKVSELLVESGALEQSMRGMRDFSGAKKRKRARHARDSRRGTMFASREDYQMTEEELAEWERQEQQEEERKKREKDLKERGYQY
jgi:CheY-like chemotaxis protein